MFSTHINKWAYEVASRAGAAEMVPEMQRIGAYYFVQTHNRHFPVEPHFLISFFQFLLQSWQVWRLQKLRVGYFHVRKDSRERVRQVVSEIILLSKNAFQLLLPHGSLFEEKLFGLTKSFIIAGKSEEIS